MVKHSEVLAHYPSDNLLAAVAGDDHLADMVVGRITARTLAEAEGVLGKILDYDEIAPAGAWRSSMLFISDRGKNYDSNEALAFEAMNDTAAGFLAGTPYTHTHLRYWSGNCDGIPSLCDPELMKQDIKDHVNGDVGDGVAVAQFAGHGNFDLWSDDVIFCANEVNFHCDMDDTSELTNATKLPLLIVHNCLTAGFHLSSFKSFGEQWLKRLTGGSVAVYAPSGLGFRFIGTAVIDQMWDDIFGKHKERMLATPVLNSQVKLCTQGSIEACQYYTLLGDPSSKLGLPDVEPPSGLAATASTGPDAFVDLTWDPSSTAGATYRVYRTRQLSLAPTVLQDGIAGTAFTDEDVTHTQTYYYHVVAMDQGFESAWSNFNTDCGETPGPDCVQAQPVNLTAPAVPSGLTVSDAETGGRLDLTWVPNVEPDVGFYTVHYGTTPAFGQTRTVFHHGSASLSGLEDGVTHYIALQATNTSGTASAISAPVMGVPNLILGVKAPDLIADLRVAKSGTDAALTWSPVTQDIYGKPKAVSYYEVYRGTDPQFLPTLGNRIGTPAGVSWTDAGALAAGGPDYFYLVRAVDTAGFPGGLGNQLPRGILDLVIEPSGITPGALWLSWSPVTTDLDDNPVSISHYEVYGADGPFTRADIAAGSPDLVVPAASGPLTEIVPSGPERYYSVLAVDARGNRSPF
jgi:hypothetical protein